jgi:hypothetical protein
VDMGVTILLHLKLSVVSAGNIRRRMEINTTIFYEINVEEWKAI